VYVKLNARLVSKLDAILVSIVGSKQVRLAVLQSFDG
jgi:hypothetical protein